MKTTRTLSLALALLLPALASAALNEGVMTYSGYLRTSAGAPETTAQTLVFKLHDASTAGNQVWTQSVVVTPDSQGWFTAVLGTTGASFFNGDFLNQSWLGIQVGAEAEMTPRTKLGAAPHALSVEYAGLSGCGTTVNQILQWSGTAWTCIATPSGTGSGLTAVTHDASMAGSGTAGAPLSLMPCADGQILQRVAGAWTCTPTPSGGGGVTNVTATAGSPITVTGTTVKNLDIATASRSTSGYLLAGDFGVFADKAPLANPSFIGTVTAPTFAGSLSGNATTATSATTATTALSANAVAANAVTPSDLNSAGLPAVGQVPALGATDSFTWVSPLTAPAAACGAGLVLTWNGSALACVADANSGGTVTDVTATGTGNPITVTTGTTTPALAFRACAAGQVLQYNTASGWVCASVSPIVATAAGCGTTCTAIPAGNTTTTYTINSVSITTPAAGNVTVDFDGSVECNVSSGGTASAIQLYGQITSSNVGSALGYMDGGAMYRYSPSSGVPLGLYDSSMNAHRTFPVGAAGAYTFYYRANNWAGGGIPPACTFFGGNMTAVYYP